MVYLIKNDGNVRKVVRAKVVPVEGMADKLLELYSNLRNDPNNLQFVPKESPQSISEKDITGTLYDPATSSAFMLESLSDVIDNGRTISIDGRIALYTRYDIINKYAGTIRLLHEALSENFHLNQNLRVMISGVDLRFLAGYPYDMYFGELGDLSKWQDMFIESCADLAKFSEIADLIRFKPSIYGEIYNAKNHFPALSREAQQAVNNSRVLSLINKGSEYSI